MNIMGATRLVHRVAKAIVDGKEETGYLTEEVAVTQHDIYADGKRKFWRGACLG
jgi:hypothetical protein